jgi:hypothetical protein
MHCDIIEINEGVCIMHGIFFKNDAANSRKI